jgi:hypothetical protein
MTSESLDADTRERRACTFDLIFFFLFFPLTSRKSLEQLILTKGDNNDADDLGLYNGPRWMRRRNIVGKVRG